MPTRRTLLSAAGLLPLAGWRSARSAAAGTVRAIVAADGSGDFQTIQRAVDHVLDRALRPAAKIVIEIRPGIYRERVKLPQDRPSLTLAGLDAASTVVSYGMSAVAAGGTFFSPIVEIDGGAFEARNLTFENTFGVGSQAVAVSVHSDRAAFHNCRFRGWQDTLYAAGGRQYYRDCYIEGHVDFIFGNAAAVFDRCQIHSRGSGYIAAHSRTRTDEPTGFVFRDCRLTGEPGLLRRGSADLTAAETPSPSRDSGKGVFLGRPWRSFARTVFLNCWMGEHIRPEGWNNWDDPLLEKTAWFAESASTGPGAKPSGRVAWARGITPAEAVAFGPEVFLKGRDGWNPA